MPNTALVQQEQILSTTIKDTDRRTTSPFYLTLAMTCPISLVEAPVAKIARISNSMDTEASPFSAFATRG